MNLVAVARVATGSSTTALMPLHRCGRDKLRTWMMSNYYLVQNMPVVSLVYKPFLCSVDRSAYRDAKPGVRVSGVLVVDLVVVVAVDTTTKSTATTNDAAPTLVIVDDDDDADFTYSYK